MVHVLLEVFVLMALIALSAFFSGAEIALFSLSKIKVRKLVKARRRGAKTLRKLKANPHRMLVTILIGNNIVNIGAAALATMVFTESFGSVGIGIATGIMTFLILIFGEIVPKSFFHQNAERMSLIIAQPVYILSYILYPVIVLVEFISKGVLRLGGARTAKDEITEEEIIAALSLGTEAGVIERDESEMMQNVIDFGDSKVDEAMTPLKRMVSVRPNDRLMDVIGTMLKTKFSRVPVYEKASKNVVGVVNLRGILPHIKNKNFDVLVKDIMEPVISLKENDMMDDAFDKLREHSAHMAVVRDRKRRVTGIVTMEDLLEEIVGEIYDESDRKRVRVHFMDRKTAIVNGDMLVKDLQDKIGIPLQGKSATISELLSARFEGKPKKGMGIELHNFTLTVVDVDRNDPEKIKRIKIVKRRGKIRK
ncbi:MAG: HlyC/CorC family transporter [Candidatus Aenigmarchaeota archaeon]|nr:HlyC/CorC family transporter [Candidatus Aenigmarchaeota archaeon]